MKWMVASCIALLVFTPVSAAADDKEEIRKNLENEASRFSDIAKQIWEFAEVGYQEEKSSALLQAELETEGFQIESGVAEIPTAFVASYGQGKPVIGLIAEFDALPGMSQDAVPEKKTKEQGAPGHGCGHHLYGTGSTAAAIAIKDWLARTNTPGTVRLYGTPAEEGGGGKIYMVRAGLFDDVDAVITWHAGDQNGASSQRSLANKSAKFRFYGQSAHAGSAPDQGRSALDAVEAMNYMVNLMREHIPASSRIHYVITRGGDAPNTVPDFAEVFYYCRHPEVESAKSNFERIVKAAEGAALGTGTRFDYEVIHGMYNLIPNETLGKLLHANLEKVGGFAYTPEEQAFAEKIHETLPRPRPIGSQEKVEPLRPPGTGSFSTDVADISWLVPTASMRAATWVPGTPGHSWQAVAAGGMSIGFKGMMVAAKTLATAAVDLYTNPEWIQTAQQELLETRGPDFEYDPLVGNRKPPLDYRK
jgi:aminobenzoyl-glutamate utilization protein B